MVDSFKGLRIELVKFVGEQVVKVGKEGKLVILIECEEKGIYDFDWLGLVGVIYFEFFSVFGQNIDGKMFFSLFIILIFFIMFVFIISQIFFLI